MPAKENDKIRYAVVGAGWISQSSFMPGVAHTGNSVMTALVTGDPEKAKGLSEMYGIEHTCGYDGYADLLRSGKIDAIYLALPNKMHAEYAIPALELGIHMLLEKPSAASVEETIAINEAAKRGGAKLMVAYRLHFEPASLAAAERVRNGEIGTPRFFSASMGQMVEQGNHRASHGFWGGPVADMAPYPINAARSLFGTEPVEVMAVGAKHAEVGFDFHDTVSVTLRFPEEKLAQFTVSYATAPVGVYRMVGTKGDLEVKPGFNWGKPLEHFLTKDGKTEKRGFPETDHFGGETQYFSNCILQNKEPEPNGEEGLADMRIVAAIERALNEGKPQTLEPFARKRHAEPSQAVTLPPVKEPEMINAKKPSGD